MKRSINFWQGIGFIAVSLLGTVLHFLYGWTDSSIVALFSAVNESTWEHMKLLFFPMFLFATAEYFIIGKNYENFWTVKLKGVLIGLLLIPTYFYTLNGVFGKTPDWVNIAIFFIAVAVAFLSETVMLKGKKQGFRFEKLAVVTFFIIAGLFFVFTFYPPRIPIFQDPISNSFGLAVSRGAYLLLISVHSMYW